MFFGMLLRTFSNLGILAVLAGVLYVFVVALNRGIQFFAKQIGYEVGDFFDWLRSIMPKRRRRK